jgi:hypothetical protein
MHVLVTRWRDWTGIATVLSGGLVPEIQTKNQLQFSFNLVIMQ